MSFVQHLLLEQEIESKLSLVLIVPFSVSRTSVHKGYIRILRLDALFMSENRERRVLRYAITLP